jgi:hypothetical protein
MKRIFTSILIIIGLILNAEAKEKRTTLEAENAKILDGATVVADNLSSRGNAVNLSKPGHSIQ